MKPSFDQLIVGSWEIISTTQKDFNSEWVIMHFSIDGKYTFDVSDVKEFVYPGHYKIEEDNLIFIWTSWGKENTYCKLSLEENGDLRIDDPRGFTSINRRLEAVRSDSQAFIDSDGKLKRRNKAEPCVPANAAKLHR